MAKNKVFMGYDYNNDKAAKDWLLGWDTNKEFDFSSYGPVLRRRGRQRGYAKLLVTRLTNRMQFDLKINRELDRLSEIVKIKSA